MSKATTEREITVKGTTDGKEWEVTYPYTYQQLGEKVLERLIHSGLYRHLHSRMTYYIKRGLSVKEAAKKVQAYDWVTPHDRRIERLKEELARGVMR